MSRRGGASGQGGSHSTRVVDNLRVQLNGTTSRFKSVLEVRRETLKASEDRRTLFTSSVQAAGTHSFWSCVLARIISLLLCFRLSQFVDVRPDVQTNTRPHSLRMAHRQTRMLSQFSIYYYMIKLNYDVDSRCIDSRYSSGHALACGVASWSRK